MAMAMAMAPVCSSSVTSIPLPPACASTLLISHLGRHSVRLYRAFWTLSPFTSASLPGGHMHFIAGRNVGRITAAQAEDLGCSAEGFVPDADFYKVEAILRPWRLSHVTSGLLKVGIRGVTVSDVRGFGAQGGSRERQAGSEFCEDSFVSKVKLEVVVSKDQVEVVINAIIDEARTGEIGDGKVFVTPVADVIRVRTGERGLKAERMIGGRADILSTSNGIGLRE
eukprot:c30068_g1_i1 orf=1-675(+)